MKALIIDDETKARSVMKTMLTEFFPEINSVITANNLVNGVKSIRENNPDIVFLDVQMPKLTGLELLELVEENPHIIFTTAYDAYAIKAFDLNAVDYLLKPFSKERFNKALDKVFEKIEGTTKTNNVTQLKNHIAENKVLDKIVVKSNSNIHVIPLAEVIYIESEDDYVMIHTNKGKHLKHQTMKFYEQQLDANKFIRIHRSFIVNVSEINKIENWLYAPYLLSQTPVLDIDWANETDSYEGYYTYYYSRWDFKNPSNFDINNQNYTHKNYEKDLLYLNEFRTSLEQLVQREMSKENKDFIDSLVDYYLTVNHSGTSNLLASTCDSFIFII